MPIANPQGDHVATAALSHNDFVAAYAARARLAAELPDPSDTQAAYGAFALPHYAPNGHISPRNVNDLDWRLSVIKWEQGDPPHACGGVNEPYTSIELAVTHIAKIIRNTPLWPSLSRDPAARAQWQRESQRAGLGKPFLRTASQLDPVAVLALMKHGYYAQGVANGPLAHVPKPNTSRMHYRNQP